MLRDGHCPPTEPLVHPTGTSARHLLIHGRALTDDTGTIIGAVTAAQDVTILKRRQEQLDRRCATVRSSPRQPARSCTATSSVTT